MIIKENTLREIIKNVLSEMKAYHGSGTRFNKFDSSFNGSGEGSNCFGPGHYFTSSKKIGKDYANEHGTSQCKIPNINYKNCDGSSYYQGHILYDKLNNILNIGKYDELNDHYLWSNLPLLMTYCKTKQEFIRKIYGYLVKAVKSKDDYQEDTDWYQIKLNKALNFLINNVEEKQRTLYQAEIPDGNYADWNMVVPNNWYKFISSLMETSEHADIDIMFEKANEILNSDKERYGKITVGNLYWALNNMYYDATFGINLFKYTLKTFGYLGIKYPSGTLYHTSSTKDGDMNYTVFDDNNIKIKNRWDI